MYEDSGTVYIVLCRKNLKTGMLYFRTKQINRTFTQCYKTVDIDIKEQFEKIKNISTKK